MTSCPPYRAVENHWHLEVMQSFVATIACPRPSQDAADIHRMWVKFRLRIKQGTLASRSVRSPSCSKQILDVSPTQRMSMSLIAAQPRCKRPAQPAWSGSA